MDEINKIALIALFGVVAVMVAVAGVIAAQRNTELFGDNRCVARIEMKEEVVVVAIDKDYCVLDEGHKMYGHFNGKEVLNLELED